MTKISMVLPVYNEIDNLPELIRRLRLSLGGITDDYEILFCVDPCSDGTENLILKYRDEDSRIKMILMSRRFGQPAATIAGLEKCSGDCAIIMDCDLQDPPELIPAIYEEFSKGVDVVHTRRTKRFGENLLRLMITHVGYFVINKLSDTSIPRNVGDFKLLSRRAIDAVKTLKDQNIFVRGLVSYVGYKCSFIDYVRDRRYAGIPSYSQLWGSIPVALHGIFCYSNKPLYYLTLFGLGSFLLALLFIVVVLFLKLTGVSFASGVPSILGLIALFGGANILAVALVGEYVGRVFNEVKDRPRYIIDTEFM